MSREQGSGQGAGVRSCSGRGGFPLFSATSQPAALRGCRGASALLPRRLRPHPGARPGQRALAAPGFGSQDRTGPAPRGEGGPGTGGGGRGRTPAPPTRVPPPPRERPAREWGDLRGRTCRPGPKRSAGPRGAGGLPALGAGLSLPPRSRIHPRPQAGRGRTESRQTRVYLQSIYLNSHKKQVSYRHSRLAEDTD